MLFLFGHDILKTLHGVEDGGMTAPQLCKREHHMGLKPQEQTPFEFKWWKTSSVK